jgi:hypothetical protein
MKTLLTPTLLLGFCGFISAAFAQTTIPAAPTVPDAPSVADAPIAASAPSVPSTTSPNQVVYTAQLPAVEELTASARESGASTVTRVEQTNSEILVTYQLANGQVNVVAYRLLPQGRVTSPAPVVVTSPPPSVVYVEPSPPRVVYYDSYRSYDPWYWGPRVSLGIGLGFGHGHHHGWRHHGWRHHGGHHGGFRHHGRHR